MKYHVAPAKHDKYGCHYRVTSLVIFSLPVLIKYVANLLAQVSIYVAGAHQAFLNIQFT